MSINYKNLLKILGFSLSLILLVGVLLLVDKRLNPDKQTEQGKTDSLSQQKPLSSLPHVTSAQDDSLDEIINKQEEEIEPEIVTDPNYVLHEAGWIPSWDYNAGVNSVIANPTHFQNLSPVWYSVNTDGSLISRKNSNHAQLILLAKQNNIEIIPTISIFDSELMKSVLGTEENYQRHLSSVLNEVYSNGYDGIDLDYESIELTEKEEFLSLIEDLSTDLHRNGKKLTVTVLSKWSDQDIYSSLSQTRVVQDWSIISDHADQIRIMAYDYTTTASLEPGPIGPYDWQIKILNYAVTKVPREKIWLGVHLYGYEWAEKGNRGSATYKQILDNIKIIPPTEDRFIEVYMESYAQYPCYDDDICTLYYMSPDGISARRTLARSYGIGGVIYWRIGNEGNLIY